MINRLSLGANTFQQWFETTDAVIAVVNSYGDGTGDQAFSNLTVANTTTLNIANVNILKANNVDRLPLANTTSNGVVKFAVAINSGNAFSNLAVTAEQAWLIKDYANAAFAQANTVAAMSGYSGYSGVGTSGYSGYSGVGTSGYSGYSGTSGYSGYSSTSGYSGYSSGVVGPTGTSGYSGYSGVGTSGYSGYSGVVTANAQFTSIGVGTPASGTTGEIRATNEITAYYSDGRLKTIIGTIENALLKINQISGVYYTGNKTAKAFGYDDKVQVGVIAQDVERVVPEAIRPAPFDTRFDKDNKEYSVSGQHYKTVLYERLIPLIIEAIKELDARTQHVQR